MQDDSAPTDPDAYADWLKERVGVVARARREALGREAYGLAVQGKLSDQTIRNVETGKRGATLTVLTHVSRQLQITVSELLAAAESWELRRPEASR